MERNILNEGEMHAFVTVFVTLTNPQVCAVVAQIIDSGNGLVIIMKTIWCSL